MDQTTATSTLAANSATADDATGTKPLHTINVNYGSTDDSAFHGSTDGNASDGKFTSMAAPPMATSQIATAPITQWPNQLARSCDLAQPKAIQEVAPTRQTLNALLSKWFS